MNEVLKYVVNGRDGVCLYGLATGEQCSAGLDPHHIRSRGSGGKDEVKNLITLCRKHHNEAQEYKIKRGKLRVILKQYFDYDYSPEELAE